MASRPYPLAATEAVPVPHCPPSLLARIEIHNHVVHRVRHFLREHGYVEIPENREGLEEGESVIVHLFDNIEGT